MGSLFAVVESSSASTIVAFAGMLDAAAMESTSAPVQAALDELRTPLIVDLTGVTFISSCAMGVLMQRAMKLAADGLGTALITRPGAIDHAIRAAKLDAVIHVTDSLSVARELAAKPPKGQVRRR